MSDPAIHHAETRYGFEYGPLSIERCWSHNGYCAIRIRSLTTGEFIDVQTTPKGRKLHTTTGRIAPTSTVSRP